jgi:hypothetical protein
MNFPTSPEMQAASDQMSDLMDEARAAVFHVTALDLLGIAELHRIDPEYALQLATVAGRDFDNRNKEARK